MILYTGKSEKSVWNCK